MITQSPPVTDTHERAALMLLGHYFTKKWVAGKTDPHYKGFTLDAESCRTKVPEIKNYRKWGTLSALLCMVFLFFSFGRGMPLPATFGILALLCFIASAIFFRYGFDIYPIYTHKQIASAWEPCRKDAFVLGIVSDLAQELEHHCIIEYIPSCHRSKTILIRVLMRKSEEIQISENYQCEAAKQIELDNIFDLAENLGLQSHLE